MSSAFSDRPRRFCLTKPSPPPFSFPTLAPTHFSPLFLYVFSPTLSTLRPNLLPFLSLPNDQYVGLDFLHGTSFFEGSLSSFTNLVPISTLSDSSSPFSPLHVPPFFLMGDHGWVRRFCPGCSSPTVLCPTHRFVPVSSHFQRLYVCPALRRSGSTDAPLCPLPYHPFFPPSYSCPCGPSVFPPIW